MAFRELITHKGFSLFFTANLALGLAGFIAIQSFGFSLGDHLEKNLKTILGGDLVIGSNAALSREQLNQVDEILGRDTQKARMITFFTMAQSLDRAKLIRVMAVNATYPLYGRFAFENPLPEKNIHDTAGLFMTRDTARTLGLGEDQNGGHAGKGLGLGTGIFSVYGLFKEDPDNSLAGFELAPKVYMGLSRLPATGLLARGSRVRYLYYYKFPRPVDLPSLARQVDQAFFDPRTGQSPVNVYEPSDVNQRLGRLTRYFTSYMGLVSLIALFLAGMAAAYLFRGYLTLKTGQTAILMCVGALNREVWLMVSLQLLILGGLAACAAFVLSFIVLPAFPVIFKDLIPAGLTLAVSPSTLVICLMLGMGGSLIFCLPLFARIFQIRPARLLSPDNGMDKMSPKTVLLQILSFIPGAAALFGGCVYVAGSFETGAVYAGGFAAAVLILSLAGTVLFQVCGLLSRVRQVAFRIAMRNLFRNKWSSLSCFVTIAMGVFLMGVIPQIRKGIETEIMRPEGMKIPVFFLVDIQEDQHGPLNRFLENHPGHLARISPMVRGRISSVNGQAFKHRGEGQGRGRRIRRLEFNFSSRKRLDFSETLVKGRPMSSVPWEFGSVTPFEISVEKSFAKRFDLSIGDVMAFDIQGMPLQGRIVNLRKVKWNSFQPNFFLLFQDGVLNDAPKTFLATITDVPPDQREDLKAAIVKSFPNISVIDVTQTAKTILNVTERLSLSVRFMAWLAIAAGLVSIFSIARLESRKNRNQINLLKVLGCGFTQLKAVTLIEFGFIGFCAALFALALSTGFSLAVSGYFFDSLWAFDFRYALLVLILTTVICMVTGYWAAVRVMKQKAVELLVQG